jgi:hypothetical protein
MIATKTWQCKNSLATQAVAGQTALPFKMPQIQVQGPLAIIAVQKRLKPKPWYATCILDVCLMFAVWRTNSPLAVFLSSWRSI